MSKMLLRFFLTLIFNIFIILPITFTQENPNQNYKVIVFPFEQRNLEEKGVGNAVANLIRESLIKKGYFYVYDKQFTDDFIKLNNINIETIKNKNSLLEILNQVKDLNGIIIGYISKEDGAVIGIEFLDLKTKTTIKAITNKTYNFESLFNNFDEISSEFYIDIDKRVEEIIKNENENKDKKQKIWINVQGAYYPGNLAGFGVAPNGFAPIEYRIISNLSHHSNDPGRNIGTTWGGVEAKVVFNYQIEFPFFTLDNILMKDNNIKFRFEGHLSPVSLNLYGIMSITPLAILSLNSGFGLGTGWTFLGFNGLGLNIPSSLNTDIIPTPFGGIVYSFWIEPTFQFDTGAIIPGDWSHILIFTAHKFEYKALSSANDDQPWLYEADSGENFNGIKYYSTFFLGYQMPLIINTVGVLVETETRITKRDLSPIINNGWGSDFTYMSFTPLFNLKFDKNNNLTILFYIKNERCYTMDTIGNRYFEYRKYSHTFWNFYRIAFNYSYNF